MSTYAWHTVRRPKDVWEQEQGAVMDFSDVCSSSQPESIDSSKGSVKEPCRGRKNPMQTSFTKATKPLFLQGSHVQFSPLSRKDLSHSGHIMGEAVACSAFSLWLGSPRMFPLHCSVHRILKALQGPRRPAVLSCREGEATVVPWHPHVVMPKMTTCYWKSESKCVGSDLLRKELICMPSLLHMRASADQASHVWLYTLLNSSAFLRLLLALSGS